jgi:hypothetical protein
LRRQALHWEWRAQVEFSTLILVGALGTAVFALAGVLWQRALPSFASAPGNGNAPTLRAPLRLAKLPASLPPMADEIVAAEPPVSELARYLDGPATDLVYEVVMQNNRVEDFDDDNGRRILIQRLQSLRRRIQAVFWTMHVLFRQEAAEQTDVVIDRNVAAALDASLRDLIRALEILPPEDSGFHALAQHPARADFAAAVSGLTLWLRDTRAAFRPQYTARRTRERQPIRAAG